jgi:hypothetical protein
VQNEERRDVGDGRSQKRFGVALKESW